MSPVAHGIEIPKEQLLLQPALDRRDSTRDLAGDEGFTAGGALVIKKDAVGGMKTIGLPVVDGDPIGVKLGRRVRRARIEWRRLSLGNFLRLAEQLRGRGLIKAGLVLPTQDADGLKQAKGAKP